MLLKTTATFCSIAVLVGCTTVVRQVPEASLTEIVKLPSSALVLAVNNEHQDQKFVDFIKGNLPFAVVLHSSEMPGSENKLGCGRINECASKEFEEMFHGRIANTDYVIEVIFDSRGLKSRNLGMLTAFLTLGLIPWKETMLENLAARIRNIKTGKEKLYLIEGSTEYKCSSLPIYRHGHLFPTESLKKALLLQLSLDIKKDIDSGLL